MLVKSMQSNRFLNPKCSCCCMIHAINVDILFKQAAVDLCCEVTDLLLKQNIMGILFFNSFYSWSTGSTMCHNKHWRWIWQALVQSLQYAAIGSDIDPADRVCQNIKRWELPSTTLLAERAFWWSSWRWNISVKGILVYRTKQDNWFHEKNISKKSPKNTT